MMSTNDTDPDKPSKPHTSTDPGLGAPGKSAAPSYAAEAQPDPPTQPLRRGRAELTPVPPETDNLLNGLLEAETESYFRKTKAAPETSGEGAAAYHAAPHAIAPGNPTPPPAPPVVVRPSVEEDFQELKRKINEASRPREPSILDAPLRSRANEATEVALPPETPRTRSVERWVAFVVAAVIAALIGVMLLRPNPPPVPVETPVQVTTAAPLQVPTVDIPVVQASALPLAPTVAPAPPPTTQPIAPRPKASPRPGDNPPPKSDVKRNL